MDLKKVYDLIDQCRKGMLEIDKHFDGSLRTYAHEREERFYRTKFKDKGIDPSVVSNIYSTRNNLKGIEQIKNSIEKKVLRNEN